MNSFYWAHPASYKRKKAYKFAERIGLGGYGEVKRAVSVESGEEVAIKIIDKRIVDNRVQTARQNTLLTLRHKHVVRLQEWFESKERYYLVFEIAQGGELYEHLMDEGHFGEAEAREVMHSLASALEYIHSRGIIHRDVKPENILYRTPPRKGGDTAGPAGDCVLSDFGLAVDIAPGERLTTICGSPGYSAPEIYGSSGYGQQADAWSLGVVCFALLGGRFPYKQTEPRALAQEARTVTLYFPPNPWNNISETAKDFVRGLLTVDESKRLTATQALAHPWLQAVPVPPAAIRVSSEEHPVSEEITSSSELESSEEDGTYPAMEKRPTFAKLPETRVGT